MPTCVASTAPTFCWAASASIWALVRRVRRAGSAVALAGACGGRGAPWELEGRSGRQRGGAKGVASPCGGCAATCLTSPRPRHVPAAHQGVGELAGEELLNQVLGPLVGEARGCEVDLAHGHAQR